MSCNWELFQVSDLESKGLLLVQDGNHGNYRPRKDEFEGVGTAFIRAADFKSGVPDFESAEKINDTALARIKKGIGKNLDTVMSTKGTVGKLAFVPKGSPDFVCSPQTSFWRSLEHDFILPEFLYYELQSTQFRQQVSSFKGETDMADYLSLTSQRKLWVRVPPLEVQRNIVKHLSVLDSSIENKVKFNQTLEQMAQALFKSWFVDFDPVIDNALAAGNPIPEPLAERARIRQALFADSATAPARLPAETLTLFPDSFEEHPEMGWIPVGWKVRPVGDVIENVGGATPKTSEPLFWDNGSHAFCTPKDMSNLGSKVILDTERKLTVDGVNKISSGQLAAGTVVMSSRAPIGYLAIAKLPVSVNQGIIALKPDYQFGSEFLLFWLEANQKEIITRANGSTFLEISKKNFRTIPFLIPSEDLCLHYSHQAKSYMDAVYCNTKQMQELTKLRDTLLPKLLSGELSLPELEAQLESC